MTHKKSMRLSVNLKVASEPEVKTLHGVEYKVLPLIGLVEGVITPGNDGMPQLALASEFGKFPDTWNNRPVVFNHPIDSSGGAVSANDPSVLESWSIGTIFNARVKDTQLLMEAWIDPQKVEALSEVHDKLLETMKAVESGQMVEVSTGLYADLEDSEGLYAGEKFLGIWRNVVPDHLAVLELGSIGACSNSDGCGIPRTNRAIESVVKTLEAQEFCDKCHALRVVVNSDGSSQDDRETAIISAMELLNLEDFFFVIAVYDDSFVYANFDGMFEREYSIGDDGEVTIGADKVRVRPNTQFVPVKASTGGTEAQSTPEMQLNSTSTVEEPMKALVKALIANELTIFTDNDAEWLERMTDEQLERLQPPEVVTNLAEQNQELQARIQELEAPPEVSVTAEEYISSAPEEVQGVLRQGLRMQKEKRKTCITTILAQKSNQFTEDELNGFELETLEKLAVLARRPNYEGLDGGGATQLASVDDSGAPEPPKLFEAV